MAGSLRIQRDYHEIVYIINSELDGLKLLKVIAENLVLLGEDQQVIDCPRCGFEMKHLQACHMICPNCGAHLDCSEKGLTW